MKTVALTGSIAMGKSTVAQMIRDLGIPVFDADACVHDLYQPGGAAVEPVSKFFPAALANGAIDRTALAKIVLNDADAIARLEEIVHPLVRDAEDQFNQKNVQAGSKVVAYDIPLLFETGRQRDFDYVLVVSALASVQRDRALNRCGMTDEKLQAILAKQVPDSIKCDKADFIIKTDVSLAETREQVADIFEQIKADA